MAQILKVTDADARADLEAKLLVLVHAAKRQTPVVGNEKLPTPVGHGAPTDQCGDRRLAASGMTTVVTITAEAGEVFIDVSCAEGEDVSVVEAIGLLEVGKALLVEQAP